MVIFKRCEKEVIQKGGNSDEKSIVFEFGFSCKFYVCWVTGGTFASDEDLAKNSVLGFYNDLSGNEVSASKIVEDYFYIEDLTATEKD